MSNLSAKLAKQQQAVAATRTSIAKLTELVKQSKDDNFKINGNLVLAQLQTKLTRQLKAVQLTEWTNQVELQLEADTRNPDTTNRKR